MKPAWHYDETFQENYWFFLGWPIQETEKYLRKYFEFTLTLESKAGTCIEFQKDNGTRLIAIWMQKKPKGAYWLGTLAHECIHAANMTLKHKGVHPDFEDDETQAHLASAIFGKALGWNYKKGPK